MENARRELNIKNISSLLSDLGENPERDGLQKTPQRVVDSLSYLMAGYQDDVAAVLKSAVHTDTDYQDMVIMRDIEVYSLCEHHMLPFFGRCHIGYIPRSIVVGLSKLPRVVDIFARRLQVQERLTNQIATAIQEHLNPLGVGVVIEASHFCMMMRGIGKQNSFTITRSMHGQFQKIETRSEFMSLVRGNRL